MSNIKLINSKYHNLANYIDKFRFAEPFPFIILDNFLIDDCFKELQKFISVDNIENKKIGKNFNTAVENNKWISKNMDLPKRIKLVTECLNCPEWISNLEKFSGIKEIFSTDVGNTQLANYHEMNSNGFLGSHVDHSSDPNTGRPHVLNIILYLSEIWKDEWGGSTLFYDNKGKKIIKEVKYAPNRAVIFLHTPYSFHGVSKINLNKYKRSSIYVDYYSKVKNPYDHLKLNFSSKWFKHETCFVLPRFADYLKPRNIYYTKTLIKYNIKKYLNL